jgi:hypothetical protein
MGRSAKVWKRLRQLILRIKSIGADSIFWEIAAVDPEAVEMVLVGRFICAPSNRFETWADWSPETKRKGKADVFLLSACSGVGNESVQRSGSSAAN